MQRTLRKRPTARGELKQEIVEQAQRQLAERYASDAGLHAIFTGFLADTIAHVSLSREKLAEILDSVKADDNKSAALAMRALAAHATAVKAHSDTLRLVLPKPEKHEPMPELIFREITDDEVAKMRREQREEATALAIKSSSDVDREMTES